MGGGVTIKNWVNLTHTCRSVANVVREGKASEINVERVSVVSVLEIFTGKALPREALVTPSKVKINTSNENNRTVLNQLDIVDI